MTHIFLLIFILILGQCECQEEDFVQLRTDFGFQEVYRWKQIGYDGLETLRSDAIVFPTSNNNSGGTLPDYIPYNNIPMGVEHYKGRLFITVPRRNPGVPSTLNHIEMNLNIRNKSPLLKPFPNLARNDLHMDLRSDPNKIISVYRTRIDECNRLWFIDTGLLEYPNNSSQVQPPSIWIINPDDGNLIHRFEFPSNVEQRGNGVASITVDVDARNCNDAFAYIPDLFFNRLYVYSMRSNRMWSFAHNYFRMDPFQGDLNVADLRYQWDDGIFSITLGPRNRNGYRDVLFHPMISLNEFVVSSEVLRNEENSNRVWHGNDFRLLGNRGPNTQSAMHHLDLNTGVIFFAEIARNAIGCINSAKPINAQNHAVLKQDNDRMIYPSDLKVDSEDTVWIFSNTMPRFIYSQLNVTEFNFRVWRANAREITRNTVCDVTQPHFDENLTSRNKKRVNGNKELPVFYPKIDN